jgi:hypothetical protein
MPHRTYRLLSQMYDVALSCLSYYVYFKEIQKQKPKEHNDWLIATHNAYYDLCVLHWCMLFGEKNTEKTHFYYLADQKYNLLGNFEQLGITPLNKTGVSKYILTTSNIDQKMFGKFRKETLLYRNKNLIHREHDPDVVHDGWITRPLTQTIIQSTFPLYELIIQLAATFPNAPDRKNEHLFPCRIFKNRSDLSQYYKKTFLIF